MKPYREKKNISVNAVDSITHVVNRKNNKLVEFFVGNQDTYCLENLGEVFALMLDFALHINF